MITSFKQLPDGQMEIHSFCAFSSSEPKTKSSRHKFDLAATRPVSDAPVSDRLSLYAGDPQADCFGDNGKTFCSLHSLMRSAGISESGFPRDMVAKGQIKPDLILGTGVPGWITGQSSNDAAKTLKSSYAAAQAAKQPTPGSVGHFAPSL